MLKLMKNDFLFLYKYKIFHIYVFMLLIYAFILMTLDGNAYDYAKVYIILSDPLILGFFFIGGIFLIEKGEGLISYQFTTPIQPSTYLLSKAIVLAITGSIIAIIISILKTNAFHIWIITSVFFGNIFFSLLGVLVVKRCKNVNDYIGYGMFITFIIAIPFIFALLFPNIIILQYNPISCVFNIVYHTYFKTDVSLLGYFFVLMLWVVSIYVLTYYDFKQYAYGVKR